MRRHFSAETIALHREGAVSARKAASIDSHLSRCSRCAGIYSALGTVSSMLAATQLPPMPDTLADRLQLAIAGESAQRVAGNAVLAAQAPAAAAAGMVSAAGDGEGAEADPARVPGRPDLPERRGHGPRRLRIPSLSSPLLLRGLAAAGAVVILAGGGFLLARGQSASENSANTGSGAVQRSAASSGNKPASYPPYARNATNINYSVNGKIATTTAIASNTNFTKGSLARQVRKEVSSTSRFSAGAAAPQASPTTPAKAIFGGLSISGLEGCLNRVAAGRKVLLADVARYLGRPATVIVLTSPTTANVFDVVIVGLSCSASNADVISRTTVPVR